MDMPYTLGLGVYSLGNRLQLKREVTYDLQKDNSGCNVKNGWRQDNPLGRRDDTKGLN